MLRILLSGVCLLVFASFVSNSAAEESIQVTVTGTLRTGIVAIGAETTGETIKAKDITWELDFGKKDDLKAAAEKLNGQQVTVTGTLERRPGVEVKERWIVTVSALKGAEKPKQEAGDASLEAVNVREGTKATIIATEAQTTIDIRCERGIGSCELARTTDKWPTNIVLNLRLRGLESLQVAHGNSALEWSVRSSAPHESTCSYRSGKRVTTLGPTDSLYSAVQLVGNKDNAAAGIPLEGYFAVTIPGKFLEGNPERLKVQWVDFYR